jgi:hypothetical protein
MAAGGGGEGGGRPGRHLLRGGIMDHRQKFFYVRRAAKLTLPPAPETLAPPLGGRGRKWKGCPPKLKSWRRHWPQWPKAKREGDFLPSDTEIRHVVGRSELLFTRKDGLLNCPTVQGRRLPWGPRVRTPSLDRADPQDSFKSGDFDGGRALGKKGKEGKFWTPVLKIWHRPC